GPGLTGIVEALRMVIMEAGFRQLGPCEPEKCPLEVTDGGNDGLTTSEKALDHPIVHFGQQLVACVLLGLIDLDAEFGLKAIEGSVDLVIVSAGLHDIQNAALDVDAGFDSTKDLVG